MQGLKKAIHIVGIVMLVVSIIVAVTRFITGIIYIVGAAEFAYFANGGAGQANADFFNWLAQEIPALNGATLSQAAVITAMEAVGMFFRMGGCICSAVFSGILSKKCKDNAPEPSAKLLMTLGILSGVTIIGTPVGVLSVVYASLIITRENEAKRKKENEENN